MIKHVVLNQIEFLPEDLLSAINIKSTITIAKRLVDGWESFDESLFTVEKMSGGVTNVLYSCKCEREATDGTNKVLVRYYGNNTDKLIDRDLEIKTISALSINGLSQKVYGTFENMLQKGLVYKFEHGRNLSPEEVRSPYYIVLISETLSKFHKLDLDPTIFDRTPSLFYTIRNWIQLIRDSTWSDPKKKELFEKEIPYVNVDWLTNELNELESALKDISPIVYCHNDLLVGNLILKDSDGKIQFIDFEYGHYNYRGFDIANHFVEIAGDYQDMERPTSQHKRTFVQSYLKYCLDRDPTEKELDSLVVECDLFSLASFLYWGTWGIFQIINSKLDFNFINYVKVRMKALKHFKKEYLKH